MDNITAQERRRQARERELEADMAVASDLMGGMGVEDGELAYNPIILNR
jgi:translation initiation factor 3 subunit J